MTVDLRRFLVIRLTALVANVILATIAIMMHADLSLVF